MEKKMNKNLKRLMAMALCTLSVFGCAVGAVGCNKGNKGEQIDNTKTQIKVKYNNGGLGRVWLDTVLAKFEEVYAEVSFEEGKQGVQILKDFAKRNIELSAMKNSDAQVFLLEDLDMYDFGVNGALMDITDVVKSPAKLDYNTSESVTIESKIKTTHKEVYNVPTKEHPEGGYYAIPFFDTPMNLNYSIDLFVKYYPNGINKYSKLLRLLSGNLHWMVDAFTYNDLLCNVYEIDYPVQFLPLLPLNGTIKNINGEVLQEGKEPVQFKLKYDKKGRLKSLDMNRVEYNDKQKNNVRINTLHVSYKKDEYDKITCSSSELIRVLMPILVDMNQSVDKIEQVMSCKTDNVLGGFVKLKVETEESNKIALDVDGRCHITGEKSLSRPHAALKQIATANGEKFPAIVSNNSSAYNMVVDFDDNAFVTSYQWDGYVLMEKNVGYDNYAYIKADSVSFTMDMVQPYTATQEGIMNHEVSLKVENKLDANKVNVDANNSSMHLKHQWSFVVKNDEHGNWVYLKVGPYEVKRTITYQ